MLVIDTNTLYYACGLSTPTSIDSKKILQEIDNAESVVIPSIAFCEFLTRYRRRAATIRRVCAFMREHHIEILNDNYISFHSDTIKILRKIRQPIFNANFERLLHRKIDIESRFASGIFLLVFISATIFECNINPYNVPDAVFSFLSHTFKTTLQPLFLGIFNSTYKNAYKTRAPENYIKNLFSKYLKIFISLYIPLCKEVIGTYDAAEIGDIIDIPNIIQNFSSSDWEEKYDNYIRQIEKKPTTAHFVQRSGLDYGKSINDKHLEALLNGLNFSIEKIIDCKSMDEYYFSIVENTLSNGGAFRKNDINDALILSCIKESDIILSFDCGMRKHMQKYYDVRTEYKNSLNYINSLL